MESYTMVDEEQIEVTVQRRIRVGQTLKINPTEAYLGIESGNIQILHIIPPYAQRGQTYYTGIDTDEMLDTMDEFMRAESGWTIDEGSWLEEMDRLSGQPWVLYDYRGSGADEWQVLPLDVFIEHTMSY